MTRAAPLAMMMTVCPALLTAQEHGFVAGRAVDALNGGPVPGAIVSLNGGTRGATTDGDGRYAIRDVRPGTYVVTARAVGFRPVSRDSVVVAPGRTVIVDFQLSADAVALLKKGA